MCNGKTIYSPAAYGFYTVFYWLRKNPSALPELCPDCTNTLEFQVELLKHQLQ